MNNKERLMNIVKILKDNNILNDRSPKNVKKTIEDLGPTFIKIGQILSTRVDLIPDIYAKELSKLRSNVTPLPFEEIEKILLQLSEKVAGRLRKGKQMAKTVAVEVKYNDFIKASRQTTLDRCTDSGTEIYQLSKELFRELWEKDGNKSVRLLGIRTANLEEQGALEQMSIMDIMAQTTNKQQNATTNISREKMKKLDKALDAIKNKYGEDKIKRASLLAEQTVDMKNKKYYEE